MQVKTWVFELEIITLQTDGLPKDDPASASQHSSSVKLAKRFIISLSLCALPI
jgi:hypothetical protein